MPSLTNIEAEQALLGACLNNSDIAADLRCRAVDFSEPLHSRIFDALHTAASQGRRSGALLIRPLFEQDPDIEAVGGVVYLAQLCNCDVGMVDALADQIADLAHRRRLLAAFAEAQVQLVNTSEGAPSAIEIVARAIEPIQSLNTGGTFDLLSIAELEQMPPPEWLVHGLIGAESLSIIYGDPGAGKSFVTLDMALRLSMGMDWHGTRTKPVGVLYIAGEGARGIGKRVTGWRLKHGVSLDDARFMLLPVAVQFMDDAELAKLIRTIDEAKRRLNFDIGLIVIDTVSRSIAGVDENTQDTMSRFVAACDRVRQHAGGACIGVHHSGKDKDRGMRGSSVLLGACDSAIRLTKDSWIVTLTIEKQKDAEEGDPLYFELEEYAWSEGSQSAPGEGITTLVPKRASRDDTAQISRSRIAEAFGIMVDAWLAGQPLSSKVQTRREGRYAPRVFTERIGGSSEEWEELLEGWLASGSVVFECFDRRAKSFGLRVVDPIT